MPIIRSYGSLQSLAPPQPNWSGSGSSTASYGFSYARIYATQPNVRTVVDFLARNIAQLGLHAYRRKSDTDRERLSTHEVEDWIRNPNPSTTRYRLMESTIGDLGIFFNAYWLKARVKDEKTGRPRIGLVRLPAREVKTDGSLFPSVYVWTPQGRSPVYFNPSEVIHFSGYNPDNAFEGLSPIETLRRILLEEIEQQNYRRNYYRNSARIEGVISRPKDAGVWSPEQRRAFKEDWQAFQGARNAGKTPVLEDGMTWTATTHSAREQELSVSRKLTREECAAAYHVPLPMVGILDHATFSNVREQHKHLYSDTLGPWNVMIEEQLEKDLVTESADGDRVYLEFNIAEKLKGTFEEQASATMALVGRPIMTGNEGRARYNLPSIPASEDPTMDQVMRPLNSTSGEQDPAAEDPAAADPGLKPAKRPPVDAEEEDVAAYDRRVVVGIVGRHLARQAGRMGKVAAGDRSRVYADLAARYRQELARDLHDQAGIEAINAMRIASHVIEETRSRLEYGHVDAFETLPAIPLTVTLQ